MATEDFTPHDNTTDNSMTAAEIGLAQAREFVAGALALLNSEVTGTLYDPSDEIDRKNCAVNLLLQAHGKITEVETMGKEEVHHA